MAKWSAQVRFQSRIFQDAVTVSTCCQHGSSQWKHCLELPRWWKPTKCTLIFSNTKPLQLCFSYYLPRVPMEGQQAPVQREKTQISLVSFLSLCSWLLSGCIFVLPLSSCLLSHFITVLSLCVCLSVFVIVLCINMVILCHSVFSFIDIFLVEHSDPKRRVWFNLAC